MNFNNQKFFIFDKILKKSALHKETLHKVKYNTHKIKT